MRFRGILFLILLVGFMGSCSDTNCPLENVVRCYYGFYESETGEAIACKDTLTIVANDSVLLNQYYNQKTFDLPMSYTLPYDSMMFYFHSPDGIDTVNIKVYHTNQPYVSSLECGTSFFHKITKVEWKGTAEPSYVDSVVINKPDVNYGQTENLKIYLADI